MRRRGVVGCGAMAILLGATISGATLGCHSKPGLPRGDTDARVPDGEPRDAAADGSGPDGPDQDAPAGAGGAGASPGVGGGAASDGGTGAGRGSAGGGGGGGQNCGGGTFAATPTAVDLLVVIDRSASMQDTAAGLPAGPNDPSKWDEVVPALTDVIDSASDAISWGLKSFPESGDECAATSVTSRIDVPIAAGNVPLVTATIAVTVPSGNGTPTSAAIRAGTSYLAALNDGRPKYLLLVTDGEPSCLGQPGALGITDLGTAAADTVSAVSAAAQVGFHTFVVGVATSSARAVATLNMLATAGLEARRDPNPLARRFYLASTKPDLVAALQTITGQIGRCSFPLSRPLPPPGEVVVTVGGMVAPRDPSRTNGWDYAGPSGDTIDVYGSWCETLHSNVNATVQIAFGCAAGDGGASADGDAGLPPETVLLYDDFEDGVADHWLSAEAETLPTGTWVVAPEGSNHVFAQQDPLAGLTRMVGGDRSWTDQKVQVRFRFTSAPVQIQLAARFVDATTYYFVQVPAAGNLKIRKRLLGSTTDLAALPVAGSTPLVAETWYTLGLAARGDTLSAFLNDSLVLTATDSSPPTIPTGGIGLGTQSNAAVFDDVKVTLP